MHPCSRPVVLFFALSLLAGVFSAASAQTTTCSDIPEEWQGTWQSTTTFKDCESGFVFTTQNSSDTICPGDCFDIDEQPVECGLAIDGSTLTISCSGTETAGPGCEALFEAELTYTLDGTTITGGGTQIVTYTGNCPDLQDECFEIEYSGTRTAGSDVCSVPVSLLNWSVLKGSFR